MHEYLQTQKNTWMLIIRLLRNTYLNVLKLECKLNKLVSLLIYSSIKSEVVISFFKRKEIYVVKVALTILMILISSWNQQNSTL